MWEGPIPKRVDASLALVKHFSKDAGQGGYLRFESCETCLNGVEFFGHRRVEARDV